MIKKIIRTIYGDSVNRYFRFGARYLAKIPSAFSREIALEQAMEYVKTCKIAGDYLEFGVYQGRTFSAACFLARERRLDMQLWAFDSFEGLPSDEGEFAKGAYKYGREDFLRNVKKCVSDLSDVHTVPGWFSESLKPGNPALNGLAKIAVAWIDCDLYESTVPVLEFLTTRIQDGTLLFFDDWFNFKGRPDFGEQKACNEWLAKNPGIKLMPYSRFGWHGQSFIAHFID